jgi:dienelactone hydrolase
MSSGSAETRSGASSVFHSSFRAVAVSLLLLFPSLAAAQSKQPPAPRVVDISAPDGTVLKGTFFAAAQPGPGVMLFHQCNRQRKVWDGLAESLAAAGVNVLTMDFRGFGESGGTPLDTVSNEDAQKIVNEKWPGDVDAAFQFLLAQPGVDAHRIGAGGASCGVNQAVQLARRHPQVQSLVLLSETTDAAGRQFLRENPQMPMFLAAADDDPDPGVVPIMQWLFSLSANPASRWQRYVAGGHGVEMFAAHPELPGTITAWWSAMLRTNPGASMAIGELTPDQQSRLLDLTDQPGGPAKVAEIFARVRQVDPICAWLPEVVVNRIGYEHLLAGDTKGAVELLKMNAAAYPNSPNVYDSLGDAYLADGQKQLARINAQRAIDLLASDTTDSENMRNGIRQNAEAKLQKLGAAAK